MNSIRFTYLDWNIRKRSVRPLFKLDVHRSTEITGIIRLRRGKVNVFYEVWSDLWPQMLSDDVFPHLRCDFTECKHLIQDFITSFIKQLIL